MRALFALGLGLLSAVALVGCPERQLPPDLPPPEYRPPNVLPWPPAAEAGTAPDADPEPSTDDAAVPDAGPPSPPDASELADAGVGEAAATR